MPGFDRYIREAVAIGSSSEDDQAPGRLGDGRRRGIPPASDTDRGNPRR